MIFCVIKKKDNAFKLHDRKGVSTLQTAQMTMEMGLRPYTRLEQLMYQRIPEPRVKQLAKRWDEQNAQLDFYVPTKLKGSMRDEEILKELRKLGRFEERVIKDTLRHTSRAEVLHRKDEGGKAFVFGVNHKAVGSEWLIDAAHYGLETVWVDISRLACSEVEVSLRAQLLKLEQKGGPRAGYDVVQSEIRNFLLDTADYGHDLDEARLWVIPMTLGYLGDTTASLILEEGGQSISPGRDEDKNNRIIIIGQFKDYNPKGDNPLVRYYRVRDILARVRHGAGTGRKVEVCGEEKLIYFGEVVTALTFKAK